MAACVYQDGQVGPHLAGRLRQYYHTILVQVLLSENSTEIKGELCGVRDVIPDPIPDATLA